MLTFFLLGFITSAQVIGYPLIAESNPAALTGSSIAVASILIMSGGFTQTLFGKIVDLFGHHTIHNNVIIYTNKGYHMAMLIMPIAFLIALVLSLIVKESYCKPIEN